MTVTMTKRHFCAIAETLRLDVRPHLGLDQYGRVVEAFADLLRGTNPRFDEGRFICACHPKGWATGEYREAAE